ncbi:Rho GTPase activating protein-like protein [Sarcoptes scabiei]|uniref:Rho GTPase activating protein-like protein n=1 Tax=Sarcoptes scabiei TaxID=52283 RepID=A0A132AGA3_SARSC|nr:Rho GTPase activating protein-like protein [Sarcoptes scabiei]
MTIICPKSPLPPKSSVFNLELDSLPIDEMVPLLIIKCINEIERRSMNRPGIYRMTGVASRVEKLLKSFESGPHLIDLSDVNVNDLTSVVKIFLRELQLIDSESKFFPLSFLFLQSKAQNTTDNE